MRSYFLFLTLFSVFLLSVPLIAHEGHHEMVMEEKRDKPSGQEQDILAKINQDYVRDIKPIFQVSCFACHAAGTKYPWYYKIPGAEQLMDHDTQEAKKHIDMTSDFPFKGHGSPSEDLDAIGEAVNKKTMPPFRYRMMHWNSGLTDDQKQKILKWLEESQDKLFWDKNK